MRLRKKKKYNVAIMGATGAVGREIAKILEERNFPVGKIVFLASQRSAGKTIRFAGKDHPVQVLDENAFGGIDIVLASAGGSISKQYAPAAVKAGAIVIDNTSAFRMDPEVPLVVPEINAKAIKKNNGIIANPNCSTIIMLVPLYPLDKVNRIRRVTVATYQAASGAGAQAMQELKDQSGEILEGKPPTKKVFFHQCAFNVFSHNSEVGPDGYNVEETKTVNETRKILNRPQIQVAATCVRVPVFRAHSEAMFIEFRKPMSPAEVREILSQAPGIKVVDEPENNLFPMPVDASNRDEILVGRIRQDLFSDKIIGLFVAGDQIRKGAALNAVQIAEHLIGARRS